MKRIPVIILVIILVLVTFSVFLPLPHLFHGGDVGSFNTISGWYWCTDTDSCLHEQAHYLDWQNDWISSSDEYNLVLASLIPESQRQNMVELYAEIYVLSGGNPPEMLAPFYQGHEHNFCIPLPRGKLCL